MLLSHTRTSWLTQLRSIQKALTSPTETIGLECSSKIVRVGTGARRKRIKLQVRNIQYNQQQHPHEPGPTN